MTGSGGFFDSVAGQSTTPQGPREIQSIDVPNWQRRLGFDAHQRFAISRHSPIA